MNFNNNLNEIISSVEDTTVNSGISDTDSSQSTAIMNQNSVLFYKTLSELVTEYSYIILFDGRSIKGINWIADSFLTFTGYNKKDTTDKAFDYTMAIHEADQKKYLGTLRNVIDFDDNTIKIDYRIKNKYGDYLWIKDTLKVLGRDSVTGYYTFLGSVQDIHKEKLVELAFQQSEVKYRQLFENSLVPIVYFSVSGKIILINKTAADNFHDIPENLIDKSVQELYSEGKAKDILEILTGINDSGIGIQREELIINKKYKKWFSVNYQPVKDLEGKTVAIQKILIDITELKLKEEKIKVYNKELTKINAGKDKLFSIIAHDLKSPFISLLGFSEYLINDLDSLTEVEVKEFATNINSSAKSIFNLLENLLQWSRLQSGKIQVMPKSFNLNDMLEEILYLFTHIAREKKIKLRNKLHSSKFRVSADNYMVDGILRNLISNALKFSRENSEIIIYSEVQDNMAAISVIDSGVGIPKDMMETLFLDNSYVSTPGTKNEKGTGLGLVITREFVELNGGKISVNSMEGKGTTFTFTLPLEN